MFNTLHCSYISRCYETNSYTFLPSLAHLPILCKYVSTLSQIEKFITNDTPCTSVPLANTFDEINTLVEPDLNEPITHFLSSVVISPCKTDII